MAAEIHLPGGVKYRMWKRPDPVWRTKAVSECLSSPASARINSSAGKSPASSATPA